MTFISRLIVDRGHSTETALLEEHSDIAEAFDEGSMTALIMLDLSAAFDVADHPILFAHLTQCVSVANKTSPDVGLLFGGPQGSVLGPHNYFMYTKPVDEIIKRDTIKYHCYGADTQVYMTLKSCDNWDDI